MVDIHSDFSQTWNSENHIIADNVCTNMVAQMIFFKDGYLRDALVINNAFHNKASDSLVSQLASTHSHVVIAHNTWSKQPLAMRTDFVGPTGSTAEKYNADRYCLIANNAVPAISWSRDFDPDLRILNNHLNYGAVVPQGAQGTTIGGSAAENLVNPAAGNFRPNGPLRANPKPAVIRQRRNPTSSPPTVAPGFLGVD